MKLPQLSLTTKIANYFLLLALITVSIVGGVAYFRARGALKQAALDRLKVAATLKEQEIARWFEDRQRDFLHATLMPDVQRNLNILLNSEDKKAREAAYRVLDKYLSEIHRIKPSQRELFILNDSSKIILSTNKQREGEYEILANITYVEKVEAGADFAPIFYVSPIDRQPAITLAKPLADRSGMILVDLDLERIDRIVREKTGLGESGESYLVGSLISKNSFIAGKSLTDTNNNNEIDSPGIEAAMTGNNGYGLYRNYAGDSVLGVYRWLNEQDIALLVEIDQAEAFGPARKLASAIVVVGLISVLWLLIGVNWLARQLSISRQELEKSSQKLQIKAQEAEAANLAKSTFLANMSHELRTPLNAILGFSQLMSRDATINDPQKESLDIINRSGEHLLNLINDILEMSKIEAGKLVLNETTFNLHLLLETIEVMFRVRAENKGLWFKFDLEANLPQYIVSDDRKLRQLLINLLGNAIKFTPYGGVTLKAFVCSSSSISHDRIKLCFSVIDTGKGIADTELDRLFDPFVQTASGIKSSGGTGLGLAISRQFAKLMGGEITAKSILGKGSTFSVNIQAKLAEVPNLETVTPYQQVKYLAPGQPNYRIAIADDCDTNRLVLVRLLESVGFITKTADNGKEAIELWQTWQPDLIWMDMRMPVMDGYTATRQIKNSSSDRTPIIIAITASAFEEQKEKIIAAGCDDFVAKPFTEGAILDKLSQHLGVEFTSTESEAIALIPENSPAISTIDLTSLSPELVSKINQAAIAVDSSQIEQLITKIPEDKQYIVRAITQMLNSYDFDGIIDLTEVGIER